MDEINEFINTLVIKRKIYQPVVNIDLLDDILTDKIPFPITLVDQ